MTDFLDDETFDALLGAVQDAAAGCKNADDIDAALDTYEHAIGDAIGNGINLSSSYKFGYVNECIKANKNDRAWGYLNSMVMTDIDQTSKIRLEQCRIRKKEGRWVNALQYLMMGHAAKYGGADRERFLKELKPIANNLPLNDDDIELLANSVVGATEREALNAFRDFYYKRLDGVE